MTGAILRFPSAGKSLVVKREGRTFAVVLSPIATERERKVRERFGRIEVARAYARRLVEAYPELYRRVIDETGVTA